MLANTSGKTMGHFIVLYDKSMSKSQYFWLKLKSDEMELDVSVAFVIFSSFVWRILLRRD